MPGAFLPILPPPQSIDSLDVWGDLDDLPYSLDSMRWNIIGQYNIVATDGVETSGSVQSQRTRTDVFKDSAFSGGEAAGDSLLDIEGIGQASSWEDVIGGITVGIPVNASSAASGESLVIWIVKPILANGKAVSGERSYPNRIRTQSLVSGAGSGGKADISRILMIFGESDTMSFGEVWPEYKGWTWRRLPGSKSIWRSIVEWQ